MMTPLSRSLNLGPHLNNKGTSRTGAHDGTGLAKGATFPSAFLPTGVWKHDGIDFQLQEDWDTVEKDNVRADGQTLALPEAAEVSSVHLVAVGDDPRGALHKEVKLEFRLEYDDDGGADIVPLEIRNWWSYNGMNKGPIRAPYHFTANGEKNEAVSNIFHFALAPPVASAGRRLRAIKLPAAGKWNALHVFAASYVAVVSEPAAGHRSRVRTRFARATRRWEDVDGVQAQVVEVALANPLNLTLHREPSAWINAPLAISLSGTTFKTVRQATITRLMPGDTVQVEVAVIATGRDTTFSDAHIDFHVEDESWSENVAVEGSRLVSDFTVWTPDADVEQHSAPSWFTAAKFGIFIHWGPYSVPAWADSVEGKYSEWYWFWQNTWEINGRGTYDHHLATYGADFVYDDFIPLFRGERFDPGTWVDLFADAGAKYWVFTTKHHDGYALFDTAGTSDRNSLRLGPGRDFLRELMDASAARQPQLKRGTYYSMPEWYNPLYAKYGRDDGPLSFFGGLARNPYGDRREEPYTGFVDVGDYISGLQVPQLRILARKYDSDLMWGDIGMANDSVPFVAEWYAAAARQGRQVTINNRLGIAGDFVTPEMEKFATVQPTLWEACQSVDPFSFGYNAATRDNEYRSTADLVHTLVDIVAKGGNFLLNVGPRADGVIVDPIVERLRGIGAWLAVNGRSIYGAATFPLVPEAIATTDGGDDIEVRFTRSVKALYAIILGDVPSVLRIKAPLPLLPGDVASLLCSGGDIPIDWSYDAGQVRVDLGTVPPEDRTGAPAYVIEFKYHHV